MICIASRGIASYCISHYMVYAGTDGRRCLSDSFRPALLYAKPHMVHMYACECYQIYFSSCMQPEWIMAAAGVFLLHGQYPVPIQRCSAEPCGVLPGTLSPTPSRPQRKKHKQRKRAALPPPHGGSVTILPTFVFSEVGCTLHVCTRGALSRDTLPISNLCVPKFPCTRVLCIPSHGHIYACIYLYTYRKKNGEMYMHIASQPTRNSPPSPRHPSPAIGTARYECLFPTHSQFH